MLSFLICLILLYGLPHSSDLSDPLPCHSIQGRTQTRFFFLQDLFWLLQRFYCRQVKVVQVQMKHIYPHLHRYHLAKYHRRTVILPDKALLLHYFVQRQMSVQPKHRCFLHLKNSPSTRLHHCLLPHRYILLPLQGFPYLCIYLYDFLKLVLQVYL